MRALGAAGFPVPAALEHNRHVVLMSLVPGVPLVQVRAHRLHLDPSPAFGDSFGRVAPCRALRQQSEASQTLAALLAAGHWHLSAHCMAVPHPGPHARDAHDWNASGRKDLLALLLEPLEESVPVSSIAVISFADHSVEAAVGTEEGVHAGRGAQVRELGNPGGVFAQLMRLAADLAARGLVHCDFNEFNVLVRAPAHIGAISIAREAGAVATPAAPAQEAVIARTESKSKLQPP